MLQTQLKSLKESCMSLKWGRSQEMLQEESEVRKSSTVLELGKDWRQKQPETLTMPLMLKMPLKEINKYQK